MLTPKENPLYQKKFSSEEDRTHDAASSRTASPTHCQRAVPAPCVLVIVPSRFRFVSSSKRVELKLYAWVFVKAESFP